MSDDLNELEMRDSMLENLLILLNSAASIGLGPEPGSLGKLYKGSGHRRSPSEMPGSKSGIKRG